jgi:uracil-DNA glycosylase family 4
MQAKWGKFRERWRDGCGSDLCSEARHVCLARGRIPCDILFVGEAPSIPADVVGEVFTGQIGAVMDEIIKKAEAERFSHAYTNIVCCVPRDPEDRAKVIPPHQEAIAACRPRLQQFIALCRPRLVMAVGYYARCELVEMREAGVFSAPVASMIHPGAILRRRPYGGYEFSQAVRALAGALTEHLGVTQEVKDEERQP